MTDSTQRLQTALAGRYQIERQIGHGGMATVYLARDTRHDRRVALKVLRPELAAVIGAERFALEIRTTANLQHPHILPLHDSGEIDGTVFYVMPFVEGETLRDRIVRDGQLPVDDAIALIKQVASALDYAHRQGVVHRDIKPENILLHDGQALVADFGIALAASKSDNASRLTETGMSLGTPSYMSPEQAMGQREISARADVYALGCVLYEMLIGEPPFAGPNAQAIVAKILTEPAPSIVKQRPRVPAGIDAAVRRALEKLPADRFGSAKEFADALDVQSPSTAAAVATSRARGRGIAWALVAAAVVAAFLLGRRNGSTGSAGMEWEGELLGGPVVSAKPRLSPDGQSLAFAAMVDGQRQLGLQHVGSHDWTVLTADRTKGQVAGLTWARDNSRIYYARYFEVPLGVWSISPLGRDEKLILENAGSPEALPDGSLLVSRMDHGHSRAFRFYPETGRLDSLNALTVEAVGAYPEIRSTPEGKWMVYFGKPASDPNATRGLYALDLSSGKNRLIWDFGPHRDEMVATPSFAVMADGRSVATVTRAGDLARIVSVPIDGSGSVRTLTTFPDIAPNGIDVGPDGSVYVASYGRPSEVHRFRPGGGGDVREPVAGGDDNLLPLPDGRWLMTSADRVMVRATGKEPVPFVQTQDATSGQMALLGDDRVLLKIHKDGATAIGIVATATGRIVGRIPNISAQSLAGSRDGKTIYYVADDILYSIPADTMNGAKPTRMMEASAVAADPHGAYLVVERREANRVKVIRYSLPAGPEAEIPVRGDWRVAPGVMASNAIGPDGRVVLPVISPASWFWPIAILDPKTGNLEFPPTGLSYDMNGGWTADGQILAWAASVSGRLWRLRPRLRSE